MIARDLIFIKGLEEVEYFGENWSFKRINQYIAVIQVYMRLNINTT